MLWYTFHMSIHTKIYISWIPNHQFSYHVLFERVAKKILIEKCDRLNYLVYVFSSRYFMFIVLYFDDIHLYLNLIFFCI